MDYLKHPLVTPEQERRIRDDLLPEETLVFVSPIGHKETSMLLGGSAVPVITFGIFWLGLCTIFLFAGIAEWGRSGTTGMKWAPAIFLVPFFAVGVLILIQPFLMLTARKKTVFALTDQRAIVSGVKRSSFLPLDDMVRLIYIERADQSGMLGFSTNRPLFRHVLRFDSSMKSDYLSCPFPCIRDIERIVRMRCLPAGPPANLEPGRLDVSPQDRKLIEDHCDPDERVIWAGRGKNPALYALTGKRALALEQLLPGEVKVTGYPMERIVIDEEVGRRGGKGDLIFFRKEYKGTEDSTVIFKQGFLGIDKPGEVKTILLAIGQAGRNQADHSA